MADLSACTSSAERELDRSADASARFVLPGLSLLALCLLAASLPAIVARVRVPHDLLAWADDYVLNELLKWRLGAPLYGSFGDANSFSLPPGGVWLHHALLAPLGLDLSVVANRVLAQVWLVLAVMLGVRLVSRLSARRWSRATEAITAALGCAAALVLAAYSNTLADSAYPSTLELLVLMLAATWAGEWPSLARPLRFMLALGLPACGVLVKESGIAIAIAIAFVAIALASRNGSRRERCAYAAASLASPVLALAAVGVATHGASWNWLSLPWRRPWMLHHVPYLAASIAALAPCVLLIASHAGTARRTRGREPDAAWLRVAVLPVAYLVGATPAFLRVGGGGFELAALPFLCAILALARLASVRTSAGGATAALLVALQLLLFSPYRQAPTAADAAGVAAVCARVREALTCGERVMSDLGSSCLGELPPRTPPLDRHASMLELTWAGRPDAPDTELRLARQEYDLLAIHVLPLPWQWPKRALAALGENYVAFFVVPPPSTAPAPLIDLGDTLQFDDRAGVDFGIALFERKRDAGRHHKTLDEPARCKPASQAAVALRQFP